MFITLFPYTNFTTSACGYSFYYYLIIEKVKTDGPRVIDFFFVNVRFNVIYFAYIIWIYINF